MNAKLRLLSPATLCVERRALEPGTGKFLSGDQAFGLTPVVNFPLLPWDPICGLRRSSVRTERGRDRIALVSLIQFQRGNHHFTATQHKLIANVTC